MAAPKPIRHILPKQPFSDWLAQLIDRRETLWFFVWRDLKVQYQKPIFGVLWSVFQPLVYFGIILSVIHFSGRTTPNSDMPFSLFLISGLSIWNFSTSCILGALNSLQSNSGIISKSFFPRFYLVIAPVLKSSIDLLIMLLIVFGVAIFLRQSIAISCLIYLPIVVLFAWIITLSWAALAASLVVANRHIRHAIPVVLYAMIFALPVFYSMNSIENEVVQLAYSLNPIAGAMDCLRVSFGAETPTMQNLLFWLIQSIVWLGIGIVAFRNTEKNLADKV